MFLSIVSLLADTAPNIKPNLDWPGAEWVSKAVGVVMGLITFGLVVLFIVGVFKAVNGMSSHHEGGAGGGIKLSVGAVFGLVIVLAGTAFLNRWLNFFG